MRGKTRRNVRGRGAFWALGTLALGGCSLFGSTAYFETVVELPIQPELAAWVVADVCRSAHPHADPSPLHAHPPVVSYGEREFQISLARARADSGYRVAMNGRITRPQRVHIGERIGLDLPRFIATGRYTQAGSTGLASIEIHVSPTAGGCSVDIALSGEAAEGPGEKGQQHH